MIIKKYTKEENGNIEIVWVINQEQQVLLHTYALESLLARGLLSTADISKEEFEKYTKELEEQIFSRLLKELKTEDMPQA